LTGKVPDIYGEEVFKTALQVLPLGKGPNVPVPEWAPPPPCFPLPPFLYRTLWLSELPMLIVESHRENGGKFTKALARKINLWL
jgi:hypothetical protein